MAPAACCPGVGTLTLLALVVILGLAGNRLQHRWATAPLPKVAPLQWHWPRGTGLPQPETVLRRPPGTLHRLLHTPSKPMLICDFENRRTLAPLQRSPMVLTLSRFSVMSVAALLCTLFLYVQLELHRVVAFFKHS